MRLAAWWRWAWENGSPFELIMRGKREITCKGKLPLWSGLGAEVLDEFWGGPLGVRQSANLTGCVRPVLPAHRKERDERATAFHDSV